MSSLLIDQNAEERREISVAILFSVLAHLLLAALVIGILAMGGGIHFSKPKEEPAPVEMVFVNPQNTEPVYVATSKEQETDKAPENTSFESDKNTKAASALEAQGKLPVPTMNGSNDQALEFEDRKFSVGAEPKQAAPPAPPAKPQQETPAQPETQQTAQEQKIEKKTEPDTQLNGIALLEPPVNKSVREIKPIRPATAVAPSQSALPAYQPQARAMRIRGGINNRGRASVDAVSTPLGRYKKMLSDAIGSRWYYYVQQDMGLLAIGTVEIHFLVHANGSVHAARVVSNSSNESFATCSLRSIMDAKIPPVPEDMARALQGGSLEVDYSFSIMSN